jgi:hypothetical protein
MHYPMDVSVGLKVIVLANDYNLNMVPAKKSFWTPCLGTKKVTLAKKSPA